MWLLLCLCISSIINAKKPNFLIFFVDDLGYGDLGFTGHPTILTPNIDALAYGGIRLQTWYSGFPLCTPSRAAMLTGRLPARVGCSGGWNGGNFGPGSIGGLDPSTQPTFASILKQVGYRTKIIGTIHPTHIHSQCNIKKSLHIFQRQMASWPKNPIFTSITWL